MPELQVSKKAIGKLFSEMQNKKFVIPDYQRPYNWNIEKCETLWDDIVTFSKTESHTGADYFLGTIVSYINESKDQEIIDGQQRITSFMLMIRSFYKKLEDMEEDDDVIGLKNQLAPCLWDIDPISQKVRDKTKIHIKSEVATDEDNETFHNILRTGDVNLDCYDNYSQNYNFFRKQCDEYATHNPMKWKELCVTVLQKCIILPIECDEQNTALTIFSTLNDRGMPLADSDIFKAQIYRNRDCELKRKEFSDSWKDLTRICKNGNLSVDDIFRYYSHVLRAKDEDRSKEIGLRKFYATDSYQRLKSEDLMFDIMSLAYFWRYINANIDPDDENYVYRISLNSRKYLQCLECYPNEYWKYITSVFFLKNQHDPNFDAIFSPFLKTLISFLFVKFIEQPSVNAIKDDIYMSCISIYKENKFQFRSVLDKTFICSQLEFYSSSRLSRALLLLDAYLNPNQQELIPSNFDIEHIFPKKWQDTNYNGWEKDDANEYLDKFGNKIVLEKKLNIQAGNGYFGIKKQKYIESSIASVIDLSKYFKDDWVKKDIEDREKSFTNSIIKFFENNLPN